MAIPSTYFLGPSGFYYLKADSSGPYAIDAAGVPYLVGSGAAGTSSDAAVVPAAGGALATATIASGASVSQAIDLGNNRLGNIVMPASVGTTTVLTFVGCHTSGGTYVTISDQYGQEYRLNNVVASGARGLDTEIFAAFRYIKVRRGTASALNTEAVEHIYTLGLLA